MALIQQYIWACLAAVRCSDLVIMTVNDICGFEETWWTSCFFGCFWPQTFANYWKRNWHFWPSMVQTVWESWNLTLTVGFSTETQTWRIYKKICNFCKIRPWFCTTRWLLAPGSVLFDSAFHAILRHSVPSANNLLMKNSLFSSSFQNVLPSGAYKGQRERMLGISLRRKSTSKQHVCSKTDDATGNTECWAFIIERFHQAQPVYWS